MEDLEQVYRQYGDTVYRFLLAQCRDEGLAEELTAETFYQAVRSIGRHDGSCKVSVWLCQIAKHLWYRHLEKHKCETEPLSDDLLLSVPSAEAEAEAAENQLELLRAVHALPEPARIFESYVCECCGETTGANWIRIQDGKKLCIDCAASYNRLEV